MTNLYQQVIAMGASAADGHMDPLLAIAIAIAAGVAGAYIFKRLNAPQIVGYVVMGVLLGPVLKIIPYASVEMLEHVNLFALGLIGFLIGGELKKEIFTKFGRQVTYILLFEGLAAFTIVGLGTFAVAYYFNYDVKTAVAIGVVFGAICAATDPASTVSVLWEYKARGPLTTMLTAIVALDDALALVLYAISVSIAGAITGHAEQGFIIALLTSIGHILGSVVIGLLAGFALGALLKYIDDQEKVLVVTLTSIVLCIGVAITLNMDVIIATMSLGVVLINRPSRKAHSCFDHAHRFAAPVYIIFFVLVGARLKAEHLTVAIVCLMLVYVIGSVVGKTLGAYLGGKYSHSVRSVTRYLGFCLYPQGGIAVGLLIMASREFDADVSEMMLLVVIAGALVLQLIGPIGVKIGATKAGEIGLNITEQDLIKLYPVEHVMDTETPVISAGMSLREVIGLFSTSEDYYYAVVDDKNIIMGAITLDGIRTTFATEELNDWLIALDIMEPTQTTFEPDTPLSVALEKMKRIDVEFAPVVDGSGQGKYAGVLSTRATRRQLSAEVLAKQREADTKMFGQGIV